MASLAIFASPVAAAAQSNTAPSGGAAPQPVTRAALSSQIDASFGRLDSNADKSLSTAEIEAAQKRQIVEAQSAITKRIEAEFTKLDSNKDGQLSLTEFKSAAPTPKAAPAADLLGQLDKNKDGKVTQDEFRSVPLANFDRIDTNKDGTISEAERSAATKQR
jgi:Ca2+-binding EF-hand superfamily protein